MITRINSCSIVDNEAHQVLIESDVHNGLPDFKIVGASSVEVKDARERVRVGIENAGFILPPKRITVSLIPAVLKKCGTGFDAAIAVSVLSSFGFIHNERISEYMIIGEVALDGSLRETKGALFSILFGISIGINKFIVPLGNLAECSLLAEVEVYGIDNLYDMAVFFNGDEDVAYRPPEFIAERPETPDFNDIKGEKKAKYALVAAIAGGHSCLLTGGGYSYRRQLLAPLSGIYRQERKDLIDKAAFKSIEAVPDISSPDIIGVPIYYYKNPKELLEKNKLPGINRGVINVVEGWDQTDCGKVDFYSFYSCKCKAENPKNCICSPKLLKDYQSLFYKIKNENVEIAVCLGDGEDISHSELETMYNNAVFARKKRFDLSAIMCNGQIPDKSIDRYCAIGQEAKKYLDTFFYSHDLGPGEGNKLLRLSRTLADMEGKEFIEISHIRTAIDLRGIYE